MVVEGGGRGVVEREREREENGIKKTGTKHLVLGWFFPPHHTLSTSKMENAKMRVGVRVFFFFLSLFLLWGLVGGEATLE